MTAEADRLARIFGSPDSAGAARILKMQSPNGIDVMLWLCERHESSRVLKGWILRDKKVPPHRLGCQDCDQLNQPEAT